MFKKSIILSVTLALGLSYNFINASGLAVSSDIDSTSLSLGACPDFFPVGCQIAVLHGDPS